MLGKRCQTDNPTLTRELTLPFILGTDSTGCSRESFSHIFKHEHNLQDVTDCFLNPALKLVIVCTGTLTSGVVNSSLCLHTPYNLHPHHHMTTWQSKGTYLLNYFVILHWLEQESRSLSLQTKAAQQHLEVSHTQRCERDRKRESLKALNNPSLPD